MIGPSYQKIEFRFVSNYLVKTGENVNGSPAIISCCITLVQCHCACKAVPQ